MNPVEAKAIELSATDIATVAAAVSMLTQFLKWQGVKDKNGPIVVLAASLLGIMIYALSNAPLVVDWTRSLWTLFASWITVALSAAGIFGFTRAGSEAVTKTNSPPSGAGGSPTSP